MAEEEKKPISESVRSEARSFIKEVKRFGREAEELALRSGEEIARISSIGKLKGKIMFLNRARERKINELGEKVMQFKDKVGAVDSELAQFIKEVEEIESKKKSCEEQIENLSKR